jgi:hypothetical protein
VARSKRGAAEALHPRVVAAAAAAFIFVDVDVSA